MNQALRCYPDFPPNQEVHILNSEFADDIMLGDPIATIQPMLDRLDSSTKSIGIEVDLQYTMQRDSNWN